MNIRLFCFKDLAKILSHLCNKNVILQYNQNIIY